MVGRMLGAARLQNDASIVPYKLVAMFIADFKVSPRRDEGIPPYRMIADIDKYKISVPRGNAGLLVEGVFLLIAY